MSLIFDSCRKLQYHFGIGTNLLLLACVNYLQTLAFVRHYWRSWPAGMAALLRLLAVFGIYFFLGWILALQNAQPYLEAHPYTAQRLPGQHQKDSVILLKAACFLDPEFQSTAFASLDGEQRGTIGLTTNNGQAAEWIFEILLAVITVLVFILRLLNSIARHSEEQLPPGKILKEKAHLLYWVVIWLLSLTVFCYAATTVTSLRSWVAQSGWMQPAQTKANPENDIHGLGQLIALVLMAAVLISALDNASLSGKRQVVPKQSQPVKQKKGKNAKSRKGHKAYHLLG